MSDQFIDQIAEDAMKALRGDDPVVAAKISAMLKENPERIDLIRARRDRVADGRGYSAMPSPWRRADRKHPPDAAQER